MCRNCKITGCGFFYDFFRRYIMADINKARMEINQIDGQMAELFCRRMDAVREVGLYKRERGLPIFNFERERQVIEEGSKRISNPEYRDYYVNYIEYVMELSKRYQSRLMDGIKIAYSGVEGAFANIAAKEIFKNGNPLSYPDFKSAYTAVEKGECDCAVLPIENSYNGDVGQVMDLAFFGSLHIHQLREIEVVQNLLSNSGATLETIKEVKSHPQALGQCGEYIHRHGYKPIESVNTAVAAMEVADSGRTDIAAIGSELAAEKYGLEIIDSHINESGVNTTRFAVFSKPEKLPSKTDDHFVMVFTVKNEAGALSDAINIIGRHGFNLCSLKSRPTKKLIWTYYFFAEGEGNIFSKEGKQMLSELAAGCSDLKVLGSFKKE